MNVYHDVYIVRVNGKLNSFVNNRFDYMHDFCRDIWITAYKHRYCEVIKASEVVFNCCHEIESFNGEVVEVFDNLPEVV